MADDRQYQPLVGYINVPADWDPASRDNAPSQLWGQNPDRKGAEFDRERARFHHLDRELIIEVTTSFRVIDPGRSPGQKPTGTLPRTEGSRP